MKSALSIQDICIGGLTEQAGLIGGSTSADPYRSKSHFDLERERVFKRAWLCIGRVEQLPKAGS